MSERKLYKARKTREKETKVGQQSTHRKKGKKRITGAKRNTTKE